MVLALASTAILALVPGWFAGSARADGDPASDVLATQSLFLPQDAGIPVGQQSQLTGLLEAAARSGYPIRAAIIASRTDLGSVTELWRQPATYARFLGQELSLVYRGPLLVVMPDGYGFYRQAGPLAAAQSALASLRKPVSGAELGAATLTAVERLAAASGLLDPDPSGNRNHHRRRWPRHDPGDGARHRGCADSRRVYGQPARPPRAAAAWGDVLFPIVVGAVC